MPFVLDASVTAYWAFEDEDDVRAEIALERLNEDEAFAPTLWWFEIRNTLLMNERRGRKTVAQTASFLSQLARLSITIDRTPHEADVLALARRHRLTVYDAAYLELARRRGDPLATLDQELATAAAAENVPLIGAP
jgi:predicted nucleic acid-binding protein